MTIDDDSSTPRSDHEEYDQLRRCEGLTAQQRGRLFEELVRKAISTYADIVLAFSLPGEQIDGAFFYKERCFLLEVKWENKKISTTKLDHFQSVVDRRPEGTLGLFVSASGFTENAILRCTTAKRPNVLLWGNQHVEAIFVRRKPLYQLLNSSLERFYLRREVLSPVPGVEQTNHADPPPSSLSQIIKFTEQDDPEVRVETLRALRTLGDPKCFPHIVALLEHDKDEVVRAEAIGTVSALNVPNIRNILTVALCQDPSPKVRAAAVDALRTLEPHRCATFLSKGLLNDDDPEVRRRAANALGDLRAKEAVDDLIHALLTDPDERVRGRCALELRHFNFPRVKAALTSVLSRPELPGVMKRAANSLGHLGDLSTLPRLYALISEHSHPVVVTACMDSINLIKSRYPEDE